MREFTLPDLSPPGWITAESPDQDLFRILRPHWETGVDNPKELRQRDECDAWLGRLTLAELLVSTGNLPQAMLEEALSPECRKTLSHPAVQRFIDDYDYFGVRFLLARAGVKGFLPLLNEYPYVLAPPRDISSFLEQDGELQSAVSSALKLLEDFNYGRGIDKTELRKWLELPQELRSEDNPLQSYANGLRRWVAEKSKTYDENPDEPVRTRFAIFDFYWLNKLFQCSISSSGKVRWDAEPGGRDWMDLLAVKPESRKTLRDAWVLACQWIQQCSAEERPLAGILGLESPPIAVSPEALLDTRTVLREELDEIAEQRFERLRENCSPQQVRQSLTGLAFSGGGIRSATFNLGILQGLKELDLLRQFDYLSTVSGGGYIGGWLMSNVLRREFWLRREADWRESIKFLRDYSNYLSPSVGFLSADSWAMLTNWSRNTILMQTLMALSIAALLLIPFCFSHWFKLVVEEPGDMRSVLTKAAGYILLLIASQIAAQNSKKERPPRAPVPTLGQGATQLQVVLPFVITAHIAAAVIWGDVSRNDPLKNLSDYSQFLAGAIGPWWFSLLFALGCLFVLSFGSLGSKPGAERVIGIAAPIGALGILYLGLCAIAYLFAQWRGEGYGPWLAFAAGPSLVLLAFSLSIVFLIGFLGRSSSDFQREWWSRLGAWFCIYGTLSFAVPVFALFSARPLFGDGWIAAMEWPALATWIATTIGGLFAANSGSTNGASAPNENSAAGKPNRGLEILATVGPYVFILGLFAALSIAIFKVLDSFGPAAKPGDSYWDHLNRISWQPAILAFIVCVAAAAWLCHRLDINVFSLNAFYRHRLARCYLGASRPPSDTRSPGAFTGFDPDDDVPLADLTYAGQRLRNESNRPYSGPFPIVNCSLNLGGSSDLSAHTRQSANFTFTPLHVGAGQLPEDVGYARLKTETLCYCGPDHNPTLGHVISVSGAAANPNMGFHTSLAVSFLLTVFNARLGGWFPNPSRNPYRRPGPRFSAIPLLQELLGIANERGEFLNLSDGGHFENLGIYELVRRRCKVIVAGDGECDPDLTFGSLGNVIRLCQVDFGATISIDVGSIRKTANGFSQAHCAIGKILYDDGSEGTLIYLKSSLTGDEDTAIREYRDGHPTFPHETTADQFFSEDQFESYRMLGRSICLRTFRDCRAGVNGSAADLIDWSAQLPQIWTPSLSDPGTFSEMGTALQKIWQTLREQPLLSPLLAQIRNPKSAPNQSLTEEIYCACQEILQLMENTYIGLTLDDTWNHPDNAGWREQFRQFARAPLLQEAWKQSSSTYGQRFRNFCGYRLGL